MVNRPYLLDLLVKPRKPWESNMRLRRVALLRLHGCQNLFRYARLGAGVSGFCACSEPFLRKHKRQTRTSLIFGAGQVAQPQGVFVKSIWSMNGASGSAQRRVLCKLFLSILSPPPLPSHD